MALYGIKIFPVCVGVFFRSDVLVPPVAGSSSVVLDVDVQTSDFSIAIFVVPNNVEVVTFFVGTLVPSLFHSSQLDALVVLGSG